MLTPDMIPDPDLQPAKFSDLLTPETDAMHERRDRDKLATSYFNLLEFARQLEREKNKAIKTLETIEEIFVNGCNTHDDWLAMGTEARKYFSDDQVNVKGVAPLLARADVETEVEP